MAFGASRLLHIRAVAGGLARPRLLCKSGRERQRPHLEHSSADATRYPRGATAYPRDLPFARSLGQALAVHIIAFVPPRALRAVPGLRSQIYAGSVHARLEKRMLCMQRARR